MGNLLRVVISLRSSQILHLSHLEYAVSLTLSKHRSETQHTSTRVMVLGGLALAIIAIFIPPLVVLLRAGCGANLLINIVLLFLGWIPAVLHAWFIIIDRPSARDRLHERKYDRADHMRHSAAAGGGGGRHGRSRSRSRSVDTRKS